MLKASSILAWILLYDTWLVILFTVDPFSYQPLPFFEHSMSLALLLRMNQLYCFYLRRSSMQPELYWKVSMIEHQIWNLYHLLGCRGHTQSWAMLLGVMQERMLTTIPMAVTHAAIRPPWRKRHTTGTQWAQRLTMYWNNMNIWAWYHELTLPRPDENGFLKEELWLVVMTNGPRMFAVRWREAERSRAKESSVWTEEERERKMLAPTKFKVFTLWIEPVTCHIL